MLPNLPLLGPLRPLCGHAGGLPAHLPAQLSRRGAHRAGWGHGQSSLNFPRLLLAPPQSGEGQVGAPTEKSRRNQAGRARPRLPATDTPGPGLGGGRSAHRALCALTCVHGAGRRRREWGGAAPGASRRRRAGLRFRRRLGFPGAGCAAG